MDGKNRETSAASVNRSANFFVLRLAVAAYLVWLGFDLLRTFLRGASTLSPMAAWSSGILFLAAGLGFGAYSVLRYRREMAGAKGGTEETGKTPGGE